MVEEGERFIKDGKLVRTGQGYRNFQRLSLLREQFSNLSLHDVTVAELAEILDD